MIGIRQLRSTFPHSPPGGQPGRWHHLKAERVSQSTHRIWPLPAAAVGLLAALSLLASMQTAASSADDAALAMVRQLNLGANLAPMTLRVASSTMTYHMVEAKVTPTKARQLLLQQMEEVLSKYQTQWDQNLALSYAEFFSTTELQSLARDRQASPYYEKFISVGPKVGSSMQARSSELLQKVATELLTVTYSAATK